MNSVPQFHWTEQPREVIIHARPVNGVCFLKERRVPQHFPISRSDLLAASQYPSADMRRWLLQAQRWPRHELDAQRARRVAHSAWAGVADFWPCG